MNRRARLIAVGLALTVLVAAAADRGDTPKKPGDLVLGSVTDESLSKKAPAAGVVVTRAGFDRLGKDWSVKDPFEVDFDKQLVVVATTQGSGLDLTTALDGGNLKVKVVGTADLKPGFRYALRRLDREGIKTINGKPIPTKD